MSDIVHGKERRIGVSVDAHADLLRERDALRAEVERLRKMLWEVNEQCPEHLPVYLLKQVRTALEEKTDATSK